MLKIKHNNFIRKKKKQNRRQTRPVICLKMKKEKNKSLKNMLKILNKKRNRNWMNNIN